MGRMAALIAALILSPLASWAASDDAALTMSEPEGPGFITELDWDSIPEEERVYDFSNPDPRFEGKRPRARPDRIRLMGEFQENPESKIHVVVDIASQTMTVRGGGLDETWPVSTARPGKVTPKGEFYGVQFFSPRHRSSLYNNAPMPWSVFFNGHIAFHGTDQERRLGSPASAGCIRMSIANAERFYKAVHEAGKESLVVFIQ